jgi:ribonuclease HII
MGSSEDYEALESFDSTFIERFGTIAGLDEAGRGPLAGPVVAAAVILRGPVRGVNDSKLLSAKDRESLYEEIVDRAYVGIGLSTPEEIDLLNILNATKLAMNRALERLNVRPSYVIVDGKYLNLKIRGRCIVGGDRLSASIASASVMAKVFRDRLMRDLGNLYPEYGYEKHKGYGTEKHLQAITRYGPSTWHRLTYRPIRESAGPELVSRWLRDSAVNEDRLFRAGLLTPEVLK